MTQGGTHARDAAIASRALTDGRGVDVVFDSVGRATFEGSLNSLRRAADAHRALEARETTGQVLLVP